MSSFVNDITDLGPLQSLQMGVKDRFARALVVVHSAVPCKEELVATKCIAVTCTIVALLTDGYSVAPYAQAKKGSTGNGALKDGERAEPLFVMDNSKTPSQLDVYSYVSKGMNRGPRCGGYKPADCHPSDKSVPPMYVLSVGTSFVYFVSSLTFQNANATTTLPTDIDYIPAMSLCEVAIAPRHFDSCTNGRVHLTSLNQP
jgi:hypothetical protein